VHAVKLPVTAAVAIECEFWTGSDDWNGVCHEFSITVRGNSFEGAKRNMEGALATHIESVLRQYRHEPAA
jgi:hypothetical protein